MSIKGEKTAARVAILELRVLALENALASAVDGLTIMIRAMNKEK